MNEEQIPEILDKSIEQHYVSRANERETEDNDTTQKLSKLQELLSLPIIEMALGTVVLLITAIYISLISYHNLMLLGATIIMLFAGINMIISANRKRHSSEIRSLQGDLTDCTSHVSVPVFMDFYARNKSIDNKLNIVILTALTRLIPLYINEHDGRIPPSLAARFLALINLQTELEFPSMLCSILDGLDSIQSTIFLPPIALLLCQPKATQVRKNVREAATRAFLRISDSITFTELSDNTVKGWFTDLSQIKIWTNYILSREEFTRLYDKISPQQFNLIPRSDRASLYASLTKQNAIIDGRIHSIHNLGTAYSLAVIAFARDNKDIIACSIFHSLVHSKRTPEVVRSAALDCTSYLDQIKAGMFAEKTLLRPSETDSQPDTLLQPVTKTAVTDELILHVVKDK